MKQHCGFKEHAVLRSTFLTCDGALVRDYLQHVPTWQSGCLHAWNRSNSVLLVSTVLFTHISHCCVYKRLLHAIRIHSTDINQCQYYSWSCEAEAGGPELLSSCWRSWALAILSQTRVESWPWRRPVPDKFYSLRILKASEIVNIRVFLDAVALSTD